MVSVFSVAIVIFGLGEGMDPSLCTVLFIRLIQKDLPFHSSLLQMKYILFVGENAAGTDDKKCAKQFKRKNSRKADAAKTCSITQSPGKGAQSVTAVKLLNQGENFSPNLPAWWVKIRYPLFF